MLSNEQQQRTVIEIATDLVNSVNDLLFSQISIGTLEVDQSERPLEVTINKRQDPEDNQLKYKKSKIKQQMQKVDEDEHRKKIRKFMSENRRIKRNRQMRSFQISEKTLKLRQQEQRERQNSKNSILQQRRKSIQERMMAKKNLLKQIQKSALQSNNAIASIRKRKFLYQQKEEQYYKNFVLPKMEQEKQLLEKRKSYLLKPMDMSEIHEHQKHYEEMRVNSRINRSLTISVIKSEQTYHPPQYIPLSYKRLKQQQQQQRLQQDAKRRESELNELRKKDFIRKIEEMREKQRELEKSRPESPKKEESKIKVKQQLNREQLKNVGNEYLRQLLNVNRKGSTTKRLKPIGFSNTFNVQAETRRKPKSQYEIQIIRQERIEEVHKIRNKKIHDLLTNKKMDDYTKQQRLLHQMEKLDHEADQKMKEDNMDSINESALILMNSIKAKMAYLRVDLSKP